MQLFIPVTILHLIFHIFYYGIGKKKRNQEQMDTIDIYIDAVVGKGWTQINRFKNKIKNP